MDLTVTTPSPLYAGSEAIAGVRLAGGPSAQEGRLELQLAGGDGTWGGV